MPAKRRGRCRPAAPAPRRRRPAPWPWIGGFFASYLPVMADIVLRKPAASPR
jgi:hypothetical protein